MKEPLFRIRGLVIKEFLLLSRDKLLLLFVLLGPLFELLLMGGQVGGGIQNLPLALVDMDRSRASRELMTLLDQTDELLLHSYEDSVAQAEELMHHGEIAAIVVVPPGYGERLVNPRQTTNIQIIADGSNSVLTSVAVATTETVAGDIMQDLAARYAPVSAGPVELRFMARFNPELDGRPSSITMMLGLIVYQVALVIAAQGLTREREWGTLEQLRVTPLGRFELIVGKAIPVLVIGLADGLVMTAVSVLWFDIPIRGSVGLLLLLTIPFILAQIGWGTLISLVSRTQQQAMMFVFVIAMLEVACSGFLVPPSTMPGIMRVISYGSSVRHYIFIVRGILLRGAGIEALWAPALALTIIAAVVVTLAWLRLRAGLSTNSAQRRLKALFHITAKKHRAARRRRRSALANPPA